MKSVQSIRRIPQQVCVRVNKQIDGRTVVLSDSDVLIGSPDIRDERHDLIAAFHENIRPSADGRNTPPQTHHRLQAERGDDGMRPIPVRNPEIRVAIAGRDVVVQPHPEIEELRLSPIGL